MENEEIELDAYECMFDNKTSIVYMSQEQLERATKDPDYLRQLYEEQNAERLEQCTGEKAEELIISPEVHGEDNIILQLKQESMHVDLDSSTVEEEVVEFVCEDDKFVWPDQAVYTLLKHYMSCVNDFKTRKPRNVWKSIAKRLNEEFGPELRVTDMQCSNKMSGLRRTYRNIKLQGYDTSWPFYELMEQISVRKPTCYHDTSTGKVVIIRQDSNFNDADIKNGSDEDDAKLWPEQATLAILRLYKEMAPQFPKRRHKDIWNEIAKKLSPVTNVTGAQCCMKIFGLKRTYRSLVEKGKSQSWPFYEEAEAVFKDSIGASPLKKRMAIVHKIKREENDLDDIKKDKVNWTRESIDHLLEIYRFVEPDFRMKKHKDVWEDIARRMAPFINVTGLQCMNKMSGLKRTYFTLRQKMRTTGKAYYNTYYDQMDSLFGDVEQDSDLDKDATTILDLSADLLSVDATRDDALQADPDNTGGVEILLEDYIRKIKAHRLKRERQRQEIEIEKRKWREERRKMHEEKVSLQKEFLELLKKSLENPSSSQVSGISTDVNIDVPKSDSKDLNCTSKDSSN